METYDGAGAALYKECQRNHAIQTGGYVVDGCGEFLKGDDGTPKALICGVCGCHRNFHRKEEPPVPLQYFQATAVAPPPLPPPPPPPPIRLPPPFRPQPPLFHPQPPPICLPPDGSVILALPAQVNLSGRADLKSETHGGEEWRLRRKPRTSLMPAQKDRMRAFAEKLGWRPQKEDEDEIGRFCSEIGISIQVFKVWIKNNRRRLMESSSSNPTAGV